MKFFIIKFQFQTKTILFLTLFTYINLINNNSYAQKTISGKNNPKQPNSLTTIVIWHQFEDLSKSIFEELVQKFIKKYKINVHLEDSPSFKLKTNLVKTAMLHENFPDIAIVPSDFIGLYKILELAEIKPTDMEVPLINGALETVTYAGKIYGIPIIAGNHLMLFYNKKFIKKPAKTWKELLEQKKELDKIGVKPVAMHYNEMYWFVPFIGAFGGWPIVNDEITLDTQATKDALKFYKSIADEGLTDPQCTVKCVRDDFYNELFAYAINGEWNIIDAQKALGKNFGIAVIPAIDDKKIIRPMYSTHALIFPANSLNTAKKQNLLKLAHYLQSDEIQFQFYTKTNRLPVNKNVFDKISKTSDPNLQACLKQLSLAKPMPNSPKMAYVWDGLSIGFDLYMVKKEPVDVSVKFMQKQAEKAWQEANVQSKK